MNDKQQIEEMAKVICNSYAEKKDCETCPTPWCYAEECATLLFCAGYRKQSEVEWEVSGLCNPKCSLCRKYNHEKTSYCPNCGAKMKGGE